MYSTKVNTSVCKSRSNVVNLSEKSLPKPIRYEKIGLRRPS